MKALFSLFAVLSFTSLQAQVPGTLDSAFAENGYANYFLNDESSFGNQIIQQPDGKLIVAGGISNSLAPSPAFLMRLNPDSTRDNSFGNNGIVEIELTFLTIILNALSEADGKITVALLLYDTSFNSNLAFARFKSDGQPDSTFGVDGMVALNTPFGDSFNGIFPDINGYFSVNADPLSPTTYLHRWNDDGSPDLSFGTAGMVTVDNFLLFDAAQQADGKLILYGDYNFDIQLLRYTTDGVIDSSFGTDGVVVINLVGTTLSGEIYTDSINRTYLQYGVDSGGFNFYPRINRFLSDGSQDMTFGTAGNVDFDTQHYVADMDFNAAGKITITGFVEQSTLNGFLIRLLDDGSMDPGFGNNGETILSIHVTNEYFDDLLVVSGKIYTVGTLGISIVSSVMVTRFNDDENTSSEILSLSQQDISVTPNPATTSCFIRSAENIDEVRIISTDGKTCIALNEINKGDAALNVEGLEPGMYFIQICQNKSIATRKLLVAR